MAPRFDALCEHAPIEKTRYREEFAGHVWEVDVFHGDNSSGVAYRQGYLSGSKTGAVRVRIAGGRGYLTIKSATEGISRSEFEYPIPVADATAMLD